MGHAAQVATAAHQAKAAAVLILELGAQEEDGGPEAIGDLIA